jgi:hypothetical protein
LYQLAKIIMPTGSSGLVSKAKKVIEAKNKIIKA